MKSKILSDFPLGSRVLGARPRTGGVAVVRKWRRTADRNLYIVMTLPKYMKTLKEPTLRASGNYCFDDYHCCWVGCNNPIPLSRAEPWCRECAENGRPNNAF